MKHPTFTLFRHVVGGRSADSATPRFNFEADTLPLLVDLHWDRDRGKVGLDISIFSSKKAILFLIFPRSTWTHSEP